MEGKYYMNSFVDQTILHYKIIEKLGEGGMGEVFKAQDTKLDRFVALKFLPSQVSASEDEKARFVQEAKAASAMNHPNVCTIYDIQEHNGQLFIVMEFIDGVTLRNNKQTLTEKRILDIGVQVAEGLAAAHEKGIVHRDIKPENIMIRKDGIVQIMDFGLAKLYTSGNVSRLTKVGTTMGTLGYMSPEQVQGLDVDHRTDIFSLGVVLYELLAGESPFKGVHETAIMYEIVNVDPAPISTVKEGIELELDNIILECLEKDKDERCQSAKELAKDLRKVKKSTGNKKSRIYNVNTSALQAKTEQGQASKSSGSFTIEVSNKRIDLLKVFNSNYFRWGFIVILAITAIYFAISGRSDDQKLTTFIASINSPPNVDYAGNNADPGDFEISHNGKAIVFVGTDSARNTELWLRPLTSEYAKPLPGTENANYPFWSYDDKYVAYFTNEGKLMKVELSTGLATEICPAAQGRGGSWNKNGDIVFAPGAIGGIYLVSSNGGTPKEIVKSDTTNHDQSLRFPFFLPDGKHFLYSIENSFTGSSPTDVVKIGSTNSDIDKTLLNSSTNAEYAGGYLFFSKQFALLCQKFDPDNFKLSGDIQTIAGNINYADSRIKASISVSNARSLVYEHSFQVTSTLVLINNNGEQTDLPIKSNGIGSIIVNTIEAQQSPDGRKILYSCQGNEPGITDLWEYDIPTKINTKITFDPTLNGGPCWSPDGKLVAFTSGKNIYIKNTDGTGNKELIYKDDSSYYKVTEDWSSDGNWLLINDLQPETGWKLIMVNVKDKNSKVFLSDNRDIIVNGKFSKDMRWVLYASSQSGMFHLYVRPVNNENGMWQVSPESGQSGWWVDNDKAIIYVTTDKKVYKVNVNSSGNNFIVGTSQFLFSLQDKNLFGLDDISKDGSEFLAARPVSRTTIPPLTYVQNWKGLINETGH